MTLFVDPPSGWKYGFPCEWDKQKYPELEDLYKAKGYPEKDINFALNYTRIWEDKMTKPTVNYGKFDSIYCAESKDHGLFFWARLLDVEGHPVLGHAPDIRTSRLVTLPDENGTFETLNTIYKKKQ